MTIHPLDQRIQRLHLPILPSYNDIPTLPCAVPPLSKHPRLLDHVVIQPQVPDSFKLPVFSVFGVQTVPDLVELPDVVSVWELNVERDQVMVMGRTNSIESLCC